MQTNAFGKLKLFWADGGYSSNSSSTWWQFRVIVGKELKA
jgi:hypothetical protein